MLYSYSGFRWRESCSVRHVAHSGQGAFRPAHLSPSRLARPDVPCGPASSQTPPATLLATFSAGFLWAQPCLTARIALSGPEIANVAASVANGWRPWRQLNRPAQAGTFLFDALSARPVRLGQDRCSFIAHPDHRAKLPLPWHCQGVAGPHLRPGGAGGNDCFGQPRPVEATEPNHAKHGTG